MEYSGKIKALGYLASRSGSAINQLWSLRLIPDSSSSPLPGDAQPSTKLQSE